MADINEVKKEAGMETVIGYILLAGVLLCLCFLVAGVIWTWAASGSPRINYTLSGTNLFHFCVENIRQITAGRIRASVLINIGMGFLLITPYMRVAASTFFFTLVERNVKYAFFTAFVLAVLTCSLFLR
jgi:uncharacterized membrane protein